MGRIGLTPQAIHQIGRSACRARPATPPEALLADALAVRASAFSVSWAVPEQLAESIWSA